MLEGVAFLQLAEVRADRLPTAMEVIVDFRRFGKACVARGGLAFKLWWADLRLNNFQRR